MRVLELNLVATTAKFRGNPKKLQAQFGIKSILNNESIHEFRFSCHCMSVKNVLNLLFFHT